ncbi:hypothetical protein [Pseudopontixanthobacter vadosimaris]|uniref:hypothetical protein n=1 Tax=Pseudopontixanthobacter vadosimaris TaxID=2726450 RepID=UPI0030B8ABF6
MIEDGSGAPDRNHGSGLQSESISTLGSDTMAPVRAQGHVAAPPPGPRWLLLLALLAGNVALALGPWSVRLADSGPVAAGFWRLFLAVPFLAFFARQSGQRLVPVPRGVFLAIIAAGMVFALDLASWHIGIAATRLGNATLFGNSGSLVLMIWGFVLLRRLPRGME